MWALENRSVVPELGRTVLASDVHNYVTCSVTVKCSGEDGKLQASESNFALLLIIID